MIRVIGMVGICKIPKHGNVRAWIQQNMVFYFYMWNYNVKLACSRSVYN